MTENLESTVVIVDEDENIRHLLDYMLRREGYRVVMAGDGREASKLIINAPPPLLILLDVELPYVDGFQLYSQIRAKPEWQNVPVVMLSAKSQVQDIVRAFEAGVADYITKPFQPEEVIARVRRFLMRNKAA